MEVHIDYNSFLSFDFEKFQTIHNISSKKYFYRRELDTTINLKAQGIINQLLSNLPLNKYIRHF